MSPTEVEERLIWEDLMIQSYRFVDEGRASQATELFTYDGRFAIEGSIDVTGRDSLAEFFAAREADTDRRTRHCLTNLFYTRISKEEVQVRATLILFVLGDGGATKPSALADVDDHLRMENGIWRIAARTTKPL